VVRHAADRGAKLSIGFNEALDKEKYQGTMNSGKIEDVLNFEEVNPGDVLFMPAGRVHAIGKGVAAAFNSLLILPIVYTTISVRIQP